MARFKTHVSLSSRGLGHRVFIPATWVRIPLGMPLFQKRHQTAPSGLRIKSAYHVSLSSRGLGHRVFIPATWVRIPLGMPFFHSGNLGVAMKFNPWRIITPALFDLVLSFPCPSCGMCPVSARNALCPECREKIHLFKPPYCPGCGATLDNALELCTSCLLEETRPWHGAVALFPHMELGRNLIHRFKYRDMPEMARTLGMLGAEALAERGLRFDCIVPVPLHWSRKLWRGFNQTELFCEILSAETKIPVWHGLRRVKRTRQQAKLSREQRKKNLLSAFSLKGENFYLNGNILLIDDVMTTGATLHAATEVLLSEGKRNVYIMVPARR